MVTVASWKEEAKVAVASKMLCRILYRCNACGYVSFVNLCDVVVNFMWICGWMDDGLVDLCGLL